MLRSFNRAYTPRIGALEESYLGTGRALGPSRLLYEIGDSGARVGELRRRMGLDSGYFSRLLRQLEHDGLITVERDPDDARQRVARLTGGGRRARLRLDGRSDDLAAGLLEPLPPRLRAALTTALAAAERIIRAATVRFTVTAPDSPQAGEALAGYFAELDARFGTGFDPALGGAGDVEAMTLRRGGAFLVVTDDRTVVGCGGVQSLGAGTAEIKRMWIESAWRGYGLGARLLAGLEAEAARLGHTRVVLDTNEALTEAIAMYRRAGYRDIERYNTNPYAHHWFEKRLDPPPA